MRRTFLRLGIACVMLVCAACTLSTISLLLDAIAAAAEAAAPIIQGTLGIDPTVGGEISEYLTQVGTGLSNTGAVIDSKSSLSGADIAQIVGIWAKIIPVALPSNVPAGPRLAIAAVAAAVQAFLNSLQPAGVVSLAPTRTITLTRGDRLEASRVAKRGQAIVTRMRGGK